MRFNMSRVIEVFYRRLDGEPFAIYPRFCFDDEVVQAVNLPCLVDGVRLDDLMKRNPLATICFYRTYALGDIIVLTPVFTSIKERYPQSKVLFVTADGFVSVFKYWNDVKSVRKSDLLYEEYDVGYYLDGVVEKDHAGDRYSFMHRLDIYCEFIGWPIPKDPVFSLPYSDAERVWAERIVGGVRESGKPVVVMQLSGAMWFNRFHLGKTLEIAAGLSNDCSVIMVHSFKESFSIDGVSNLAGQTTVHELAALIDNADAVITMDSGVLWVAHCTKTPIIAMFGHTRAKEKMAYHRNYHAIDLAKMVGCESCFGRQTRCGGSADCLKKSDTRKIIEQIKEGIRRLVYS